MIDWSLVVAVTLVVGVTAALVGWAFLSVGNVEMQRIEWAITSVTPEVPFDATNVDLPGLKLSITAINDVDYFYKTEGEWGIVGVKMTLEASGGSSVVLPLNEAYIIDSNGTKRQTSIMKGYRELSAPPEKITIIPGKRTEIKLVSSKAYTHNELTGWLITLLSGSDGKVSFVLPVNEDDGTVFYKIDFGVVSMNGK